MGSQHQVAITQFGILASLDSNYEAAIIHVGINDITRCKNKKELENLPTNIMKIYLSRRQYGETIYFIYNSVY